MQRRHIQTISPFSVDFTPGEPHASKTSASSVLFMGSLLPVLDGSPNNFAFTAYSLRGSPQEQTQCRADRDIPARPKRLQCSRVSFFNGVLGSSTDCSFVIFEKMAFGHACGRP